MARGANRRKLIESVVAVGSTSTSGTCCDSENSANADNVIYQFNVTTATAGTIQFVIQGSLDDGVTWFSFVTAEMNGDTGVISVTGAKHLSMWVPFGTRTRVSYTIVTGPFAFNVLPCYSKGGSVYS